MSYTKEMQRAEVAQAAGKLGNVLQQWGISERVNADGTGTLTDSVRSGLPPVTIDYVCGLPNAPITVTRITEGSTVVLDAYAPDPTRDLQIDVDDFLARNPQIEAALVVKEASIPYSPLARNAASRPCRGPRR